VADRAQHATTEENMRIEREKSFSKHMCAPNTHNTKVHHTTKHRNAPQIAQTTMEIVPGDPNK